MPRGMRYGFLYGIGFENRIFTKNINEMKKTYLAPELEQIDVTVEQGFAGSGDLENLGREEI